MKNLFIIIMILFVSGFAESRMGGNATNPIDDKTQAVIVEDLNTFDTHRGVRFVRCDTITLSGVDSAYLHIQTPANYDSILHLEYGINGTAKTTIGFYKDTPRDSIDLTDTVTMQNTNFTSSRTNTAFIEWGRGDIDSTGEFVCAKQFGDAGAFSISQGGSSSSFCKMVLDSASGYLFELRTVAGDTSSITFQYGFSVEEN